MKKSMAYSAATGETARIRNLTAAIRPVCALNRLLLAILPRWALADAADRKRLRVTVAKFFREHAEEAEQCLTRLFIALSTFAYEEFPHDLKELFNLCYTSIQIMERLHRQHFPENKLIHRFYHNELDIFRALMPNKSEQGKAMWKAMIAKLDLTLSDIRTLCTLTAESLDPHGAGHIHPHNDILKQLRNISDGLRKSHENEREILTWVSEEPEKHQPKDGRRISTIKRNMTYIAARAIHTAPPDRATAIGLQFFNTFKETPGAYTCLDSFMKQVRRTLDTFQS